MSTPDQNKEKQRTKLLGTFLCVLFAIIITNAMAYIVNNLGPNAFVRAYAYPLLIGLAVILTVLTMIISTDRETLLPLGWSVFATFGKKFSPVLMTTFQVLFSIITSIAFLALLIGGIYFFSQLGNMNRLVLLRNDSQEVILAHKYCDALQKQNYVEAYSYYGGDSSTNPLLVSQDVYIKKAKSLDQIGKITSCTVVKEMQTYDGGTYSIASNSSDEEEDFVLMLKIEREDQPSYLVHLTVHESITTPPPLFDNGTSEWIKDIDRL